ncbi:cryptochrome-1 [Anopheles albimanus]|uniref:Cryptochrome-1 n=1 Tax=Anopheles albimanus TaxID=7167 RepID=A0A182F877_ANOAL|nr:cryptochrome-1 [Anopheles albimanus]XP_035782384.1 cryptochrome-1 [Anopheles albimanus]XP_035782385.1 cryptochrome-1 [Anopheles albimanus]XP_035782386.1 cryptochrome-1 [Anopheles albimanus]XP_035782387.1 cryptochrome-1 [Anopheles albimanus]XP_035782388.1 cryptochrome-1 [Anopheles albimanus]
MTINNILWFRHGLRLHDNPSRLEALKSDCQSSSGEPVKLFPVFIFDGESAGTRIVGYNRMKFLLESLADLDRQFRELGGQLLVFRGDSETVLRRLFEELNIKKLCFEQDCEPIWRERDERVTRLCETMDVKCVENVSHTLWNPNEVIQTNGDIPPLTYQMFLHTVDIIGEPPRPVGAPDFEFVEFGRIPAILASELKLFQQSHMPGPEEFGLTYDGNADIAFQKWFGGETRALESLGARLKQEEEAFREGYYLPTQAKPEILGPATSMSAALRFGCLSVRMFYWCVHDLFAKVQASSQFKCPIGQHITGQLIWREYFYTMSVRNPHYGEMERNPICLNIPWYEPVDDSLVRWKEGRTGFPLIDAAMRQLLAEGWLHHILRNITATFLTRGGLWISWEAGLQHFLKYLLDADWSVCAGNWMWVSSSAFERLLDSSKCTCPIALAYRLDPTGDYVKRYVPELANFPAHLVHEPWKATKEEQLEYGCTIGQHYPAPMVDLNVVAKRNAHAMAKLREQLVNNGGSTPPHCRPSDIDEIRQFFWLADDVVPET